MLEVLLQSTPANYLYQHRRPRGYPIDPIGIHDVGRMTIHLLKYVGRPKTYIDGLHVIKGNIVTHTPGRIPCDKSVGAQSCWGYRSTMNIWPHMFGQFYMFLRSNKGVFSSKGLIDAEGHTLYVHTSVYRL
jgi:hypothetical protein